MDKDKRLAYIRKVVAELRTRRLTVHEKNALWGRIEQATLKSSPSPAWSWMHRYRFAAASIVVVAALSILLWWSKAVDQAPLINRIALHNQYLLADTGAILLTAADQRTMAMEDGEVIDLAGKTLTTESPDQFSTLTVPYGKRTEILLSDGSKIWLNAGSQLTFPEEFGPDKREVYLEGEGYFDVAHDEGRPFLVHAADIQIKVLGTAFNVSSYREDAFVSAVLLSGKIELQGVGRHKFETQVLEPGNTAVLLKDNHQLIIQHRDNAADHISWTQKQLVLNNTPLDELLVKLERVYNAEIADETGTFSGDTFSGRLDLRQPLLSLLQNIYDQQRFKIVKSERRITIQKKN